MFLEETCRSIGPVDSEARRRAAARIDRMTMPNWALGRLLDLAVDLAGIAGTNDFHTERKRLFLMAGDHGIVAEGVCPQPSGVTTQMVRNFSRGGGAARVMARVNSCAVTLVDMGVASNLSDLVRAGLLTDCKVARGTANFARTDAMTLEQARQSVESGIRLALDSAPETDLFAVGEMGIGNTTPSSAIAAVFCGMTRHVEPLVGRGAGLPPEKLAHKCAVIRDALAFHAPDPADPLGVLAKVGGFEIGGMAGVILGAAAVKKAVMLDGFIAGAAALLAQAFAPHAADYMILGHGSAEPGHRAMAEKLGKKPLLDLGLRLGEGSGAVLAMPLCDAAAALMREMTTFEDAQVTTEGLDK